MVWVDRSSSRGDVRKCTTEQSAACAKHDMSISQRECNPCRGRIVLMAAFEKNYTHPAQHANQNVHSTLLQDICTTATSGEHHNATCTTCTMYSPWRLRKSAIVHMVSPYCTAAQPHSTKLTLALVQLGVLARCVKLKEHDRVVEGAKL